MIDIAGQKPKLFDPAFAALAWRVIAMCELQGCPTEVLERTERWPIIDPAHLPEERWREIRDEIGRRVDQLLAQIRDPGRPPEGGPGLDNGAGAGAKANDGAGVEAPEKGR